MLSPQFLNDLFANFPPGQNLLAEVRAFYGPALVIERHDEPDGMSHFSIDAGTTDPAFKRAQIQLNTTTVRTKAALMHELLHLILPARGFNLVRALSLEPRHQVAQVAIDHIAEIMEKLTNSIHHDIFIDEFLRSGLSIEQFLVDSVRQVPNYKREAKQYQGQKIIEQAAWFPWSWWTFEYINNHLAAKHGRDGNEAARLNERVEKFGSRILADFKQTTRQLRAWVLRGKHRDPRSYMEALRELMDLLHMPKIQTFSSLTRVDGAAPRVDIIQ